MEFQNTRRALKVIYDHSNSDSSDDVRRKQLHVMYGGSSDIMSRRIIKSLCQVVAATAPTSRAAPHHKWMEMSIGFSASDCPKNMVGARQLLLVVSSTITNFRGYHILIDGGAALNLTSLTAFQKLQIPMSRLSLSHPFLGVGLGSIILCGSISLLVTFGMLENYHTESIIFDVVEVNLPFNAIIGRLALYQFMVIAHYEYLVMKMSSPNGIIKICGDCSTGVSALEKLQALVVAEEVVASYGAPDQAPLTLHQRGSSSAPHVQPSGIEDVPMKIIEIGADVT
jgi:hypothetical protein